jgi:DNA-binding transcriptional ArsR family regulator
MDVGSDAESGVAKVAAAIGEPARARMLFCLMDGHARTSTELSVVAGVSPSTASAHLDRLKTACLLKVTNQGKHRFYSLEGPDVASALESLNVLAGGGHKPFVPRTPSRLRAARTCYDHMAGMVGVSLHDRFHALGWLTAASMNTENGYDVTSEGQRAFEALGIDLEAIRALRRHFASVCLDWSERRPHIGGAMGAAILKLALNRKWVVQELDSRALRVTGIGRREMLARFGLQLQLCGFDRDNR